MLAISLIVGALAVTRITRFLVEDKLALAYRQFFVRKFGKESLVAYLIHCPWCTSFWVAIPIMIAVTLWPNQWVLAALAPWAGSMVAGLLLDRE
jgi:uncharacterized protein DUF1360